MKANPDLAEWVASLIVGLIGPLGPFFFGPSDLQRREPRRAHAAPKK